MALCEEGRQTLLLAVVLLLAICSGSSGLWLKGILPRGNFVSTSTDGFGESEVRIVAGRSVVLEESARGLVLRRSSDGKRLVRSVYEGGSLKDCDYTEEAGDIKRFMDEFLAGLESSSSPPHPFTGDGNVTLTIPVGDRNESAVVVNHVPTRIEARKCRALYRQEKRVARQRKHRHVANGGAARTPRRKRQLYSMLIYPGTKWCGCGDTAEAYEDLGSDASADVCCRQHDYCPFVIERFSTRYNLFNYRLHTLSHCECDEKFYRCLKQTSSANANLIGRIYFNIFGTSCFTFQKQKVCVQRSWWGKCRSYDETWTAIVKSSETF